MTPLLKLGSSLLLPTRLAAAESGAGLVHIGRRPEPRATASTEPDWKQASPVKIERALQRALGRPTGGWYALGASRQVTAGAATRFEAAGRELVAWRDESDAVLVAPAECPHMGADLSCGPVQGGKVVCPWHGLALGPEGHGRWRPLPAFDDGVLLWVRLDEAGQAPTESPVLAPRPRRFLEGVIAMDAVCDPEDIIANRLDPWHGAHYHPHSFAALSLLDETEDVITLRVSFRVLGRLCVEVDCTFHSPEPRTITMTIVDGEGVGLVVETHATPLAPGKTRMIEATLATSERLGFEATRSVSRVARPLIEKRAARLWVEDVEYAERRYALRQRRRQPTETRPKVHLHSV